MNRESEVTYKVVVEVSEVKLMDRTRKMSVERGDVRRRDWLVGHEGWRTGG